MTVRSVGDADCYTPVSVAAGDGDADIDSAAAGTEDDHIEMWQVQPGRVRRQYWPMPASTR